MADHRPDVYYSDELKRWVFRASSITRCDRSLVAAALGHEAQPAPAVLQRAWAEGTHGEDRVLELFRKGGTYWHPDSPALKSEGTMTRFKPLDVHDAKSYHQFGVPFNRVRLELLDDDQFTMETPVGSKAVIRGHLDGVAECFQGPVGTADDWKGRRFVEEAKLFGVDYFKAWVKNGMADPKFTMYAWQLALYMDGTGLPAYFIVGEKKRWDDDAGDFATPIHERYDLDHVHVTRFDEPPASIGFIKAKVLRLVALIEKGEMPPCDQTQYGCAYPHLCDDRATVAATVQGRLVEIGSPDAKPEPVKVEGELALKVERLVEEWEAAKKEGAYYKTIADSARKRLDEALIEVGLQKDVAGSWDVGKVVVEWQVVERKAETKPRAGGLTRTLRIVAKDQDETGDEAGAPNAGSGKVEG